MPQLSQRRASMGAQHASTSHYPPSSFERPAPSRRSMSSLPPYSSYAGPSTPSTSSLLLPPSPLLTATRRGYSIDIPLRRPRTPSIAHVDPAAASTLSLPSTLDSPRDESDDVPDPSTLSLASSTKPLVPHPPPLPPLPDDLEAPSSSLATDSPAPGQPHDRLTVPVLHDKEKQEILDSADELDGVDLEEPLIDWKALRDWRTYCQWCHWPKYAVLFFLLATSIPVAIEHKPLVDLCRPWIVKLGHMPAGWIIPIVILFIISFPPLFGHEIIAVLVGLVWGFGVGFIITAVGSVLGEIGNFYAFRYLLGAKGHRAERTNLRYACLARIIRDGGFVIAVIVRLSAVPGHLTTAVFSTCGMHFLTFTAAAALSMPKQMATVYLGVVLLQSADGHMSPRNKALSAVVILITVLVTIFAALWIYWKMSLAYPVIIAERRLAREARAASRLGLGRTSIGATKESLASLSQLPLPQLEYEGAASPALTTKASLDEKEVSTLSLPRLAVSVYDEKDDTSSSSSSSGGSPPLPPTVQKSEVEIAEAPRKGFAALVHRLRVGTGRPSPGIGAAGEGMGQGQEMTERRPVMRGRAISDLILPARTRLGDPEKGTAE